MTLTRPNRVFSRLLARWQVLAVLLPVLWAALAAWQYHEYQHASQAARHALRRQGQTVMKALVGGIRFHRRFGPGFPSQLQAQLEALAEADDVLAVAVAGQQDGVVFRAGRNPSLADIADTLAWQPAAEGEEAWTAEALVLRTAFRLDQLADGGLGSGPGRGLGRLRRPGGEPSPFVRDQTLVALLALDRTGCDAACRREARLRLVATVSAGGVLALLAVAWWASLRLADATTHAAMLEAEARHLRDLGQAAAGLAHETRNPLALIRGWAQRLSESSPSPDEKERLHALIEECDRVTSRINQFLSFVRPAEPVRRPVALGPLVQGLARLLEPDLEAHEVRLNLVGLDGVWVHGDAEMLRQALFNLAANAIHFAPPRSEVEIAAVPLGASRCRIEIRDRGPGVPAEHVQRLFSPYFTTRPDGTGLGLAMVRRVASAHGWTAGYRPREGGGAIFFLDCTS